ncbi:hypothetical protein JVT61DRAFT_14027 [Boletus reticuloceps]|uniref:Uncharacterized protein n=1 Tax=Boletus reticuloceps TaxID=495285 RepID=A0A8I3ADB4_9AGAM|nr:hypothetical protein JVT61DRAFT_14027 [Boletus reticuloceps]
MAPKNSIKESYQEALHQSYACEDMMKADLLRAQSAMVLQSVYCTRIKGQLAAREEKEHTRRVKKAKLMGDGLPRYLTGDEFYHQVAENEKRQVEGERRQEVQQKQQDEQAEAIAIWRQAESSHIERNKACRQEHQEVLAVWNNEKDQAKAEGQRVGWKNVE